MRANGKQQVQLTNDGVEKRGPAWSPDGQRLLFACRIGALAPTGWPPSSSASWTPSRAPDRAADDQHGERPDADVVARREGHRVAPDAANQLRTMHADGPGERQITLPPGLNLLATSWGVTPR